MQMTGNASISLDCHYSMDVYVSISDLAGAGHLGRHGVLGDHILTGVVLRHGRDRESINRANQTDDSAVRDALTLRFFCHSLDQFGVAYFNDDHGLPSECWTESLEHGGRAPPRADIVRLDGFLRETACRQYRMRKR